MRTKTVITALCCGLILFFVRCANPGSGTETGNPKVAGVLYNQDGSRAAGAKVACIPRNHNPYSGEHSDGDSTVTDDTGRYYFETMPADTYDILASKDTSMAFRDPVVVTADQNTGLLHDTLMPAGSIKGIVRLEEGGDPRPAFVLFMGSNTFTMVNDSEGNFSATNMAKGKYRVMIFTTVADYKVMDTSFSIKSGVDTILPDTLRLQYTGIPIPEGLRIDYDTLKQIVTLIWDKPTNGRKVKGYNIYRRNVDSNTTIATINLHLVTDTIYSDSTGTQDQTYEYSVAVMDTNNTEGVKGSGNSVKVKSAFSLFDSVGTLGSTDQQLNMPGSAICNGNSYVIIDVVAPYPSATKAKFFDSNGVFVKAITVRTSNDGSLLYPYCSAISPQGNLYIVFKDSTYKYDTSSAAILSRYGLSMPDWPLEYIQLSDPLKIYSLDRISQTFAIRDTLGDTLSKFTVATTSYGDYWMTVDTSGKIFIADGDQCIVTRYTPSGIPEVSWGAKGNGVAQLKSFHGFMVDKKGHIYIDDQVSGQVKIFKPNGEFTGRFDSYLNTKIWHGTINDNTSHILTILNSNGMVGILEGNVYNSLFLYMPIPSIILP
jgi:hypothetical protein